MRKSRRGLLILICLLLPALVLAGWFGFGRTPPPARAQGASAKAASAASVPVVAGEARRAEVPIYLSGIGTVQAFNSVLVKTRVDGQIVKIGFVEGQNVHAGDVLVEIDPHPFEAALAQAQAAKLKDQAQLDNARLDFGRANRLVTTGAGTGQALDTSRAQVAQLDASLKADQAMIDTAQIQLNYTRIRAPFDGRAGTRLLDAGNIARATDMTGIVTINQIHPISVDFDLPAGTLPQIRAAMASGDIIVTAADSDGRDLATGKLAVIDNQINVATATLRYKASFDNADESLWPGQFVDVRLQLATRHEAITVPVTAVLRGPEGTYAFIIGADHIVQKRPLKVSFSNKNIAVIDDGLKPGEQVVTDGQYRIQAGTPVTILPQTAQSPSSPAPGSPAPGSPAPGSQATAPGALGGSP